MSQDITLFGSEENGKKAGQEEKTLRDMVTSTMAKSSTPLGF